MVIKKEGPSLPREGAWDGMHCRGRSFPAVQEKQRAAGGAGRCPQALTQSEDAREQQIPEAGVPTGLVGIAQVSALFMLSKVGRNCSALQEAPVYASASPWCLPLDPARTGGGSFPAAVLGEYPP